MRRWLPKLKWPKTSALDAFSTGMLALILCLSMVSFLRSNLYHEVWQPVTYGISEDGAVFLSLNLEGIRLHDAQSGTEIDHVQFAGPLAQDLSKYTAIVNVLHPLELAAPSGGEWFEGIYEGKYGGLGYGRARIKISPSKRYVVATFPAGYFLFWDRTKGQVRIHAEPDYLFEAVTLDESQDRLLIEAIPRSDQQLLVSMNSAETKNRDLPAQPSTLHVLIYRLGDRKRLETIPIEDAGKRIGDDINLRLRYDETSEEYRVMRCDDFPVSSERVILRFQPRKDWRDDEPEFFVRRIDENHAVMVDYHQAPIEMISSADPTGSKTRWELPKAASNRTWLDCGAVTLGKETKTGVLVTTWDEENSFAVFEIPQFDTYSEAALIRTALGERQVRLTSLDGMVVDLPLGKQGEIASRSMQFRVATDRSWSCVRWTIGAGAIWCLFAAWLGRIRSHGSWLVLAQWLFSGAAIFAMDGLLAGAPYALLGYAPLLILEAGVILLAVIRCIREFSVRMVLVCIIAISTIVVLGQSASVQLPSQPTWSGGNGCCIFTCFGGGGMP